MPIYNANLIIRESRKAQGLTQEQLAEGICSRETIVKLEKGERKPNWFVFKEILTRLGLDPEIYQGDIASEGDITLLKRYQRFFNLMNTHKLDEAKAEIDTMEAEKNTPAGKLWQQGLGHELLLRMKASFYSAGALLDLPERYKYLDPALAIKYTLEYIKLTRPDFEIEKIPDYFLAMYEYQLLTILAKSYAMTDGADKAILMWYNIKATAMRAIGHLDESRECSKKVLLFNYLIDGHWGASFTASKKYYEDYTGEQLDLSVPW